MILSKAQSKGGLLKNVKQQFNKAADLMNLDQGVRKILQINNNEIVVHFPVRMDNGEIEIFKGFRVQHNNALGPYKGGLRYHETIDMDASSALASWMTWKTSLARLPFGGAKGGVQFNPALYSQAEVERVTRRFTYAMGDNIGPEYDIPAPDVNTTPQTMAWIADTYMSTKGPDERAKSQHIVTGKPVGAGGLEGRDRATGFGVVVNIKEWANYTGQSLVGKRFIVQGFGKVGYWAAHYLSKEGAIMVGVQDESASLYTEDGIDVETLFNYSRANNFSIAGFSGAMHIADEDFFALNCDICIPAALGNQITIENAHLIKASLIAEGANGPVDPEADEILIERGITIIPDILCNSGGVIGSYFEWLQNRNGELWGVDMVLNKLENYIIDSYRRVMTRAEEYKTDARSAAYIEAIARIEVAYKQMGIFP
ncbi:glutamate dehydrogenase (NAD(P)+) [Ekhidna lutea]|uniref:Glutamate dehydrogenase n=2 Tax=Ekhidna lutea TaxID=447679 RepID=A0A239KHN5_EKHLU|nr:glutamate dehydrogenase (NAD(P)+) [Ekhidna lutea]